MVYIAKQQLLTRIKRYKALNQMRLQHALALMGHEARFCLSVVPVLLHYNHVNLVGYRPNAPHGIDLFSLNQEQQLYLNNAISPDAPQPKNPTERAILGIYAMGSTSSLGQGAGSDLDLWVCTKVGLSADELTILQDKCRLISSYAKSRGVELNLFVTPQDRFTNFQPDSLDDENCGSAQNFFLLDEFYRTSIRICGRYILWYLISSEEESTDYHAYTQFLLKGITGLPGYDSFNTDGMVVEPNILSDELNEEGHWPNSISLAYGIEQRQASKNAWLSQPSWFVQSTSSQYSQHQVNWGIWAEHFASQEAKLNASYQKADCNIANVVSCRDDLETLNSKSQLENTSSVKSELFLGNNYESSHESKNAQTLVSYDAVEQKNTSVTPSGLMHINSSYSVALSNQDNQDNACSVFGVHNHQDNACSAFDVKGNLGSTKSASTVLSAKIDSSITVQGDSTANQTYLQLEQQSTSNMEGQLNYGTVLDSDLEHLITSTQKLRCERRATDVIALNDKSASYTEDAISLILAKALAGGNGTITSVDGLSLTDQEVLQEELVVSDTSLEAAYSFNERARHLKGCSTIEPFHASEHRSLFNQTADILRKILMPMPNINELSGGFVEQNDLELRDYVFSPQKAQISGAVSNGVMSRWTASESIEHSYMHSASAYDERVRLICFNGEGISDQTKDSEFAEESEYTVPAEPKLNVNTNTHDSSFAFGQNVMKALSRLFTHASGESRIALSAPAIMTPSLDSGAYPSDFGASSNMSGSEQWLGLQFDKSKVQHATLTIEQDIDQSMHLDEFAEQWASEPIDPRLALNGNYYDLTFEHAWPQEDSTALRLGRRLVEAVGATPMPFMGGMETLGIFNSVIMQSEALWAEQTSSSKTLDSESIESAQSAADITIAEIDDNSGFGEPEILGMGKTIASSRGKVGEIRPNLGVNQDIGRKVAPTIASVSSTQARFPLGQSSVLFSDTDNSSYSAAQSSAWHKDGVSSNSPFKIALSKSSSLQESASLTTLSHMSATRSASSLSFGSKSSLSKDSKLQSTPNQPTYSQHAANHAIAGPSTYSQNAANHAAMTKITPTQTTADQVGFSNHNSRETTGHSQLIAATWEKDAQVIVQPTLQSTEQSTPLPLEQVTSKTPLLASDRGTSQTLHLVSDKTTEQSLPLVSVPSIAQAIEPQARADFQLGSIAKNHTNPVAHSMSQGYLQSNQTTKGEVGNNAVSKGSQPLETAMKQSFLSETPKAIYKVGNVNSVTNQSGEVTEEQRSDFVESMRRPVSKGQGVVTNVQTLVSGVGASVGNISNVVTADISGAVETRGVGGVIGTGSTIGTVGAGGAVSSVSSSNAGNKELSVYGAQALQDSALHMLTVNEALVAAQEDGWQELEAPLDETEWFDFGSISKCSPTEYFGSGLWLLYKAIDSPFKVVLKILLMEAYSSDYTQSRLLASDLKDYMLSHDGYSIDLDAYYLMYLKVSQYLQRNKDPRLTLMRKCFYLKIFLGISQKRPYSNADYRLKRGLLNKFSSRWGWSEDFVRQLERVDYWKMAQLREFSQEVYRALFASYQALLRFSVRHGIEYAITSDDAGILSRKLYAAFDLYPGKILIMHKNFSNSIEERNLTFIKPSASSLCRRGWHLYTTHPEDLGLLNMRAVYVGSRLCEVVTWASLNGLLTSRTINHVCGASSMVSPLKIKQLSSDVTRVLKPKLFRVNERSLQRTRELRGCVVLLNLEQDPTALISNRMLDIDMGSTLCCGRQRICLIGSVDLVLINSWGEVRSITLPSGEDGVVELLATMLRIIGNSIEPDHDYDNYRADATKNRSRRNAEDEGVKQFDLNSILNAIEVCCYASAYADLIKYDMETIMRQVINCLSASNSSEFMFDVGRNSYMARSDGRRGVTINLRGVFASEEFDIRILSRYGMRPEFSLQVPAVVDRYATVGIVQYFFSAVSKNKWDIYIINERNEVSIYKNFVGSRAALVNAINRFYTSQSQGQINSKHLNHFNLPQYFVLNKDQTSLHPFTIRGESGQAM